MKVGFFKKKILPKIPLRRILVFPYKILMVDTPTKKTFFQKFGQIVQFRIIS